MSPASCSRSRSASERSRNRRSSSSSASGSRSTRVILARRSRAVRRTAPASRASSARAAATSRGRHRWGPRSPHPPLPTSEHHGEAGESADQPDRREHPDQRVEASRSGNEQYLCAVPRFDEGDDVGVGEFVLGDEFADLIADRSRRAVLRDEHALAGADRARHRLAIASTRSAWVSGPVERNAPTARHPATTNASRTQPGHRLTRLFHAFDAPASSRRHRRSATSSGVATDTARGTAGESCRVVRRSPSRSAEVARRRSGR